MAAAKFCARVTVRPLATTFTRFVSTAKPFLSRIGAGLCHLRLPKECGKGPTSAPFGSPFRPPERSFLTADGPGPNDRPTAGHPRGAL
jgi:hypothetical protein